MSIDKIYGYIKYYNITCDPILTVSECEDAAVELGMIDTTAENDNHYGVSYDPSYCYYEDGRLKFNLNTTNTGDCVGYDVCLCHAP